MDATNSLVFIDGYANGVFKGDNAWNTINPMTQPSQPGNVGPSDPTSFHDIDIEIPDITIQNLGPQDITASASLADVYNAGQSTCDQPSTNDYLRLPINDYLILSRFGTHIRSPL
ncbi:MAG TPA: hypothetical protein VN922_05540 [Bacteroidia bacterium]|nr:hypothetical protein [Bacteroidia bacterium]